ncbi:MAG: lipid-A-disaccharide synthase [Pyrinomonadaceae bacterium]
MSGSAVRLMIVAGEASGDAHGAALAAALRQQAPGVAFDFFGGTGRKMRAAGVRTVVGTDDLSITGLLEIGVALPKFWRAYRALVRAASEHRPDAVILIDWPDFNLHLARRLRARGLKVIYYISPQLWAWRRYRVRAMRRDVSLLLSILPFEPQWYGAHNFERVEYIGHPLVGSVVPQTTREQFHVKHDLDAGRPLIALLPGSRRKEIQHNLPLMLETAALLHRSRPQVQFVLALAPNREIKETTRIIEQFGVQQIKVVHGETREALAAADAAAIASGTATLEAALIGTPLVIVYKESALNWHTLGRLISTEHFGLINLIAGERIATELMQNDFTAEKLAGELTALLDPARNRAMRAMLRTATDKLGAAGASARAAATIMRALEHD